MTTILSVRRDDEVAMGGDGQVSLGNTVMKGNARKVRRLYNGQVIAGFAGGLVLSAVKRSLGAKDWGTMIEGHSGVLDRMDSVSFAAPVFYHLTNYYFAA